MSEFFATMLALTIIIGVVWGVFALLAFSVSLVSLMGVPQGLLYFLAGICFAGLYKKIGRCFADFCDMVWGKISSMIRFR